MPGRECYHCKQWIEERESHDCWTTTEAALTADLSEDLREAWERLRETAVAFGEQRILRPAEEKGSRGLRLPAARDEGAAGPQGGLSVKGQSGESASRPSS
jgi:hypothetical protein